MLYEDESSSCTWTVAYSTDTRSVGYETRGSENAQLRLRCRDVYEPGVIGMTIQFLLMWDMHVIHTYAYSTVACLHLAPVISLANAPRLMQGILSLATFGWFAVVWVLSPIYDWDNCDLIQGGFILLALAVLGGVIWMVPPRYRREIHTRGCSLST
jgi:hypothetical protein